jgi:hypothetical protein
MHLKCEGWPTRKVAGTGVPFAFPPVFPFCHVFLYRLGTVACANALEQGRDARSRQEEAEVVAVRADIDGFEARMAARTVRGTRARD